MKVEGHHHSVHTAEGLFEADGIEPDVELDIEFALGWDSIEASTVADWEDENKLRPGALVPLHGDALALVSVGCTDDFGVSCNPQFSMSLEGSFVLGPHVRVDFHVVSWSIIHRNHVLEILPSETVGDSNVQERSQNFRLSIPLFNAVIGADVLWREQSVFSQRVLLLLGVFSSVRYALLGLTLEVFMWALRAEELLKGLSILELFGFGKCSSMALTASSTL